MEARIEEPPPEVTALVERAAYTMGVRHGRWRVELFFEDGRVRKWTRQEEGGRDDLRRFERRDEGSSP